MVDVAQLLNFQIAKLYYTSCTMCKNFCCAANRRMNSMACAAIASRESLDMVALWQMIPLCFTFIWIRNLKLKWLLPEHVTIAIKYTICHVLCADWNQNPHHPLRVLSITTIFVEAVQFNEDKTEVNTYCINDDISWRLTQCTALVSFIHWPRPNKMRTHQNKKMNTHTHTNINKQTYRCALVK